MSLQCCLPDAHVLHNVSVRMTGSLKMTADLMQMFKIQALGWTRMSTQ